MTLARLLRSLLVVLSLSGLSACGSLNRFGVMDRPGPRTHQQAEPKIIEVRTGERLSQKALAERLARHAVILLGELHDNRHHHQARAELIESISQARQALEPLNLVVEQLPVGGSVLPGEQVAETRLLEQLRQAGFQEKAWAWPMHEPIFRAALTQGMAVHGGNLVRGQSMQLFRQGEPALPEKLQGLLAKAPLATSSLQTLNKALVDGHCGQLPETVVEPMRLVQRATDLALLVTAAEHAPSVVIAGNGHVRKDFGMPTLLPALPTIFTLVAVGFIEAETAADKPMPKELPDAIDRSDWAMYDYVWVTPAAQREDPCKGFQMPKR